MKSGQMSPKSYKTSKYFFMEGKEWEFDHGECRDRIVGRLLMDFKKKFNGIRVLVAEKSTSEVWMSHILSSICL